MKMSEIWNLSTLCRCCHADGNFKSLNLSYQGVIDVEIYAIMLQETLGITLSTPPIEASYTICDNCIHKLRDAKHFKNQVLMCEEKFKVYCTNELFLASSDTVKLEVDDVDDNFDHDDGLSIDGKISPNIKQVEQDINNASISPDTLQENESLKKKENSRQRGRPQKRKPGRPKTSEKSRAEQRLDANRRYKQAYAEVVQNAQKLYADKHPEVHQAAVKRYTDKNPELHKAAVKRHTEKKPVIDDDSQTDGKISLNVKDTDEYNTEVDIKHPIEEAKKEEQIVKQTEIPKETTRNRKVVKSSKNIKKETSQRRLNQSLIIEVNIDNGVEYSCKSCGGCYQTKKEINDHFDKQHPVLYKCEYCNKQLKSQYTFNNHLKIHTGDKFSCHLCPKTFCTKFSLKIHVNAHTKDEIYKCDICQKAFIYKLSLKRHIILHSGTNKKKLCDLCGNSFNDKTNLEIHIRTVHEKQRLFHCNFCEKTYTTKKHLKNHLKIHLGGKGYQCDVCDHRLSCPKQMRIHRLKHENKYMCKFCCKIFDDPKSRKDHIKFMHHQFHPCDVCGKTFTTKNSLNRHLDDHKGIKKFPCEICGFKFSQKSQLLRHNFRKHNPEANIDVGKTKCDICKKSFKNIATHMDSHNNRKYTCDICGKTYHDNSALNRHKSSRHFGRSFDCDVCGKTYLQKSKLNTHKIKVHKIKIEKDSVEGS